MDQKKLAKATAKLQQKQEKREITSRTAPVAPTPMQALSSASASQVTSKKEAKLEAKGNNRSQDIRIENFDVSFGDRLVFFFVILVLLSTYFQLTNLYDRIAEYYYKMQT